MSSKPQQPKERENIVPALNVLIEALSLAKEISSITPVGAAFGSVSALVTMIRDSVANEQDYVDLGRSCADVCKALDRGLKGRQLDEVSQSVLEAIEQLTTTVAGIQQKIIKQGKRNAASRLLHAKSDKDNIAAWKQDLNKILHIFNTELAIDTNVMVADLHRKALSGQGGTSGQAQSAQASTPLGESPPPAPKACFGRDDLIEKVVGLAENFEPSALIGVGGIGKTSVALAALHHDRIRDRFGDNRWFIRCDEFPPSRAHFLARLSKVIGAGVENPEDLRALRPLLSSREMFIILDNIEPILDPKGASAREIYAVVDELCQFKLISVCITSRITTIPRHCKRLTIPPLSMEAACNIFYGIYNNGEEYTVINDLVQRLDFHPLSVALLATVASHNMWDHDRLAKEWETHRVQVLQTEYNESLAATIELSLASPTFSELGPDARDLLGVIAFFPQGVNEEHLDRLFPAIPDRKRVFDKLRVLSLTCKSAGFIKMLAPIRDYFRPHDPKASPLLCTTKDCYLAWLSVDLDPGYPGFQEAQWIKSEDLNVENLLDVFTSVDANSEDVWHACFRFMQHLYWHKPRRTPLMPKIEGLPDDHRSKPHCLSQLSRLSGAVANYAERKRLLVHALMLWRQRGNDARVARTLQRLSDANRLLNLYEEGIRQAKEASEIFQRLGKKIGQTQCLSDLAWLLFDSNQLDAAEATVSRVIDLLPEKGQEYLICESHHLLGKIHRSKGEKEKAVCHFETALRIASSFEWYGRLFWNHYNLAHLLCNEGEFDDANAHIGQAKSHAVDDESCLGRAMEVQADIWCHQCRFEDARSEVLRALEIYRRLGAENDAVSCRDIIRRLDEQ